MILYLSISLGPVVSAEMNWEEASWVRESMLLHPPLGNQLQSCKVANGALEVLECVPEIVYNSYTSI